MLALLHNLLLNSADKTPDQIAVVDKNTELNYSSLAALTRQLAGGLRALDLGRQERVAIYLSKRVEGVAAIFAATLSGGVFVPVNPLLKPEQVAHILNDCNVRILVTSNDRLAQLAENLNSCKDLRHVVTVDTDIAATTGPRHVTISSWQNMIAAEPDSSLHRVIDQDVASIFYTSGSTGRPKGVVLSHRNMVSGAKSVAQYLGASADDRMLAVLPFSFDYGFSQLSIAFYEGATAVLMDYLFPKDVIKVLREQKVTTFAGVPPLWVQLAKLEWPVEVKNTLRYITNSGGAMPQKTLAQLRQLIPETRVFLMYGLTEAFRSTYLDPEQVDIRPDSIGKAIPDAEILVVNDDGQPCAAGEPGELVHRGALVSLGYWNDEEKTKLRFRPVPGQDPGLVNPELAVWSGDTVKMDDEGYLYFVGRRDDMIKASGYRVSPTEVEEAVYDSGFVAEAIAIGVPSPEFGQAIVVVAVPAAETAADEKRLLAVLGRRLPNFMVPARIVWRDSLPRNPNGKIDRKSVQAELADLMTGND